MNFKSGVTMELNSNDFCMWLEGFIKNIEGDMPKGHLDLIKERLSNVVKVKTSAAVTAEELYQWFNREGY
jgi:hypothetical protein